MISKTFFKSSFVYTFIGALPLATSLVLLPFYTYFLSTSQFGQLALYISFTLLVQVLVSFSLEQAVMVHYHDYKTDELKAGEFIGSIFFGQLMLGIAFIFAFSFIGPYLFRWIFGANNLSYFPFGFMSVLTAVCNAFFKTYNNLLMSRTKPIRFLWGNLLNFVLTIIISLVGLYMFPHSLIGPMWGRLLSGIAIFLWAFIWIMIEYGWHSKWLYLMPLFAFCLPLILLNVLAWILSYIDRYFINHYLTTSDVGIYDFAVKCTILLDFFQTGLAYAIQPRVFSYWKEHGLKTNPSFINKYYSAFTGINVLLIAVLIFIIPIGVPLIVKKEAYYAAFPFVPVLAAGFMFRILYYMFQTPVLFTKKTRILPLTFFITAIIQIALSIVLVPRFGIWSMVWLSFLIRPLQTIIQYFFSRKIYSFHFNIIKFIVLPAVACIEILLTNFLLPWPVLYINIVNVLFCGLFTVIIYRNEILSLYKSLRINYF